MAFDIYHDLPREAGDEASEFPLRSATETPPAHARAPPEVAINTHTHAFLLIEKGAGSIGSRSRSTCKNG